MSAETIAPPTGMQGLLADLARRWRPGEIIGRPLTHEEAKRVLRSTYVHLAFMAPDRYEVERVMHSVDGSIGIHFRVEGMAFHRHLIAPLVAQGLRDLEADALRARRLAFLRSQGALS